MKNKEIIPYCRICGEEYNLETVIDFGKTPLANNYLTKEDLILIDNKQKEEYKANLSYFFCKTCGCFQLKEIVDPNILFKNYLYASSSSGNLREYFKNYCEDVIKRFNLKEPGKFVTVVASNDGVELENFARNGIECLGVEPATNLYEIANKRGLPTLNMFFNKECAKVIIDNWGKSDLVMFNNVAAHIPNIHEFFDAVKTILKDDGIIVFENFSLLYMLQNNVFDVLYHEHMFKHSCFNLNNFLDSKGFVILDWKNIKKEPHEGYFICYARLKRNKDEMFLSENVVKQILEEKEVGINKIDYYKKWTNNLENIRYNLLTFITTEMAKGKTFCAYGYPAKATTLCKYFEIGDKFKYVVENSKVKQGLFTPEYHVQIVDSEYFKQNPTDYCIVLAWNFYDLIVKNNLEYKGKWVNPFNF